MRSHRLKLLLAVLLCWATRPAWSLQSSGGHGRNLACVHACARANAWLTQNGKFASLGDGNCSVHAVPASTAVSVERVGAPVLPVLAGAFQTPIQASLVGPVPRGPRSPRSPPLTSRFLWSHHPSAQAPPTLL